MTKVRNSGLPSVIIHCGMSVDGRVAPAPNKTVPKDAWNLDLYIKLQRGLRCDAAMVGSNTVLELNAPRPRNKDIKNLRPETDTLIIIPDSRGRVRWTGWQDDPWLRGLVVLCSKATPRSYIGHLQREGISHVIAGQNHVDLRAALKEVKESYRVKRIVCQGGGIINGALLRAGLVNEVSVLIAPFAVGGIDTPTLFDAPNLVSAEYMTHLKLFACKRFEENFVWLHYQVIK